MAKVWQKALLRILILAILFTSAGTFVLWDYYRADRDFSALMALKKMKPTFEQMTVYIQAPEVANRPLVFSLKQCLWMRLLNRS